MIVLVALNTLVFLLLSAVHVYWALGGKRWMAAAVPARPDGAPVFRPGRGATLAVAVVLLLLAVLMIGNLGWLDAYADRSYFSVGAKVVGVLFLLRAIGDFRFVGFTKSVKGTVFSRRDTWLYSPLCVAIGIVSLVIAGGTL